MPQKQTHSSGFSVETENQYLEVGTSREQVRTNQDAGTEEVSIWKSYCS